MPGCNGNGLPKYPSCPRPARPIYTSQDSRRMLTTTVCFISFLVLRCFGAEIPIPAGSKRYVFSLCKFFRGNTAAAGEDDLCEKTCSAVRTRKYLCLLGIGISAPGHLFAFSGTTNISISPHDRCKLMGWTQGYYSDDETE